VTGERPAKEMNQYPSRLIATLCLCSFAGIVGLRQFFTRYRPESPQPALGRTVGIDANYGKTVFVTPKEETISNLVNASALLPIAIAATCFVVIVVKTASTK
jgi:hypothetical protein